MDRMDEEKPPKPPEPKPPERPKGKPPAEGRIPDADVVRVILGEKPPKPPELPRDHGRPVRHRPIWQQPWVYGTVIGCLGVAGIFFGARGCGREEGDVLARFRNSTNPHQNVYNVSVVGAQTRRHVDGEPLDVLYTLKLDLYGDQNDASITVQATAPYDIENFLVKNGTAFIDPRFFEIQNPDGTLSLTNGYTQLVADRLDSTRPSQDYLNNPPYPVYHKREKGSSATGDTGYKGPMTKEQRGQTQRRNLR